MQAVRLVHILMTIKSTLPRSSRCAEATFAMYRDQAVAGCRVLVGRHAGWHPQGQATWRWNPVYTICRNRGLYAAETCLCTSSHPGKATLNMTTSTTSP